MQAPQTRPRLPQWLASKRRDLFASFLALTIASQPAFARDGKPLILDLLPGQTIDAYFQFNLSGTVHVRLAAKPGESACADFWWIKWPLGNIQPLGRHCNAVELEIPGLLNFAISSKLRAGNTANPVKIGIADTASVANSIKFSF